MAANKMKKANAISPPSSATPAVTVRSSGKGRFSLSVLSPNMMLLVVFPAILLGLYAIVASVWDFYYVLINEPLDLPLITDELKISATHQQGVWSTYNPDNLVGLQPLLPQSLCFGMAWFIQSGVRGVANNPVSLHMSNSPMVTSHWNKHDGSSFGQQIIRSNEGYTLKSEFISSSHSGVGDTWTIRVTAEPLKKAQDSFLSIILYLYNKGRGQMELAGNIDKGMVEEIFGHTPQMKDYRIHFPYKFFTNSTEYSFLRTHLPPTDDITTLLRRSLVNHNGIYGLSNHKTTPTTNQSINFIAYQINSLLLMPIEIDTVFESGLYSAALSISGKRFAESAKMKHAMFDQRFEEIFKLVAKGFPMEDIIICKRILSQVLSSIKYEMISNIRVIEGTSMPEQNYFSFPLFGSSHVDGSYDIINEGYYLLLITRWNLNITKRVIGHWFDMMNNNGWMPSKVGRVNSEDTVLDVSIAYAPSILMAVESLVNVMEKKGGMDYEYLRVLFTRLEVWYNWFNETQSGPVTGSTYTWRGRDTNTVYLNPETPPSGMGDYPRSSSVHYDDYHLDLRCWVTLGARVLARISKILNKSQRYYNSVYKQLMNIKQFDHTHWSSKHKVYSDYGGNHNPNIKLTKTQSGKLSKHITGNSSPRFIGSVGYVSLFPFMFLMLPPDSPKLGIILRNIQDPTLLWSQYGVRSLAKTDYFYHKPNRLTSGSDEVQYYWRGPVHVHINYQILRALNHYSNSAGPFADTAHNILKGLRQNLINTVMKEYKRTGLLWSHYSDKTGHGKGDKKADLSSLILLIMAEIY